MKVFLFVLAATILEAVGDAVLRIALRSSGMPVRVGLFAVGGVLLTLYGTSLNLAPVEFATVTGLYVATLFVVFQVTNLVFFHQAPSTSVLVGGACWWAECAGGRSVLVGGACWWAERAL